MDEKKEIIKKIHAERDILHRKAMMIKKDHPRKYTQTFKVSDITKKLIRKEASNRGMTEGELLTMAFYQFIKNE